VRVPENQIGSADDLRNLPVMPDGRAATIGQRHRHGDAGETPGEIDHWNSQRMLSVTATSPAMISRPRRGRSMQPSSAQARRRAGRQSPRTGQVEQMLLTLASLRGGLLLAIVVVLLLLAANFQSIRAALVVLSTTPGGTRRRSSGAAGDRHLAQRAVDDGHDHVDRRRCRECRAPHHLRRERRRAGDEPATAAIAAARGRLRPILMTSAAMIAGMIPMALGLGEGGAQSAPLGRAVIGGLIASTVATLGVLPAMCRGG